MKSILDFSKSEQYNLSIRLSPDGFSFYISETDNGGKALYQNAPFAKNKSGLSQVEDSFYRHEHLLLPYRRTEVIVVSPNYSFVPNDLYVDGLQEQILSFQFKKNEGKILTNEIHRQQVYNIFSIDNAVYSFLHRSLTLNRVIHYTTPLVEYFAERSRFGNYSKMFINIEPSRIDLFCFDRSRLELVNTFPYKSISDAAYFVLYAWEKAGFHQTNDELHICGNPDLRNRLMPFLTKYVQRVSALNPPTGWYVAPENNEYLPVDLKTISLCV